MNFNSNIRKNQIIGIDIGSSFIKAVHLAVKSDGSHLVKPQIKEIKKIADNAGQEKEIVSALQQLVSGVSLKDTDAVVCVNCQETEVRKITVPHMPQSELRKALMLEAKSYFSLPISQAELDFEVVSEVTIKGIKKYNLIAAVSPAKTIAKYIAILDKAGIKPVALVPSAYALQKLACYCAIGADALKCIVDIGERNTELIICKDKELVFSRKIPVAGGDFTKAMTDVLSCERGKIQLSLAEAEMIKRQVGIPFEKESEIIENKVSRGQVLSMIRPKAEQLVNELGRSFDYYREEGGGKAVDSLVLFGGGANLLGLGKFTRDALGIEVKIGDAFACLKIAKGPAAEKENISCRLDLAVGAALSGTQGGVNLLPVEIKDLAKMALKRSIAAAVTAAVVCLSILFYIGLRLKDDSLQKRLFAANTEFSSLNLQVRKAKAKILAGKVLVDEPHWRDVFLELTHLIPDTVYLNQIKLENNIIKINGVVESDEGAQALSDFVLVLEKGIFNNVKLIRSNKLIENHATEFELKCWIDNDENT